VTLNDLERCYRPNGYLISPNSVAFWADCVKVVEDTRTSGWRYTDTFCSKSIGQRM